MISTVGVMRLMTLVQLVVALVVGSVYWWYQESSGVTGWTQWLGTALCVLILCALYPGLSAAFSTMLTRFPVSGVLALLVFDVVYPTVLFSRTLTAENAGTDPAVALVWVVLPVVFTAAVGSWVWAGFTGRPHEWDTLKGFVKSFKSFF